MAITEADVGALVRGIVPVLKDRTAEAVAPLKSEIETLKAGATQGQGGALPAERAGDDIADAEKHSAAPLPKYVFYAFRSAMLHAMPVREARMTERLMQTIEALTARVSELEEQATRP